MMTAMPATGVLAAEGQGQTRHRQDRRGLTNANHFGDVVVGVSPQQDVASRVQTPRRQGQAVGELEVEVAAEGLRADEGDGGHVGAVGTGGDDGSTRGWVSRRGQPRS